jgi:hypothetical protein
VTLRTDSRSRGLQRPFQMSPPSSESVHRCSSIQCIPAGEQSIGVAAIGAGADNIGRSDLLFSYGTFEFPLAGGESTQH